MADSTMKFTPAAGFLAFLRHSGQTMLEFLRTLEAARACAAAVENRAQPASHDLRRLGIDPQAFAKVRLT